MWRPRGSESTSTIPRWDYANAVTDEHPTSWLVANREHPSGIRVLVSYHEIMPYEYNELVKVL